MSCLAAKPVRAARDAAIREPAANRRYLLALDETRIGMNKRIEKVLSLDGLLPSLKELLSFRGRTGRGDFFVLLAFPLAAWVVTVALVATNGWYHGPLVRNYSSVLVIVDLVAPLLLVAATVRRLHDLDRPSWWAIPFLLIPVFALIGVEEARRLLAGELAVGGVVTVLYYVAMIVLALLWAAFLYLMSRKGSGPNQHGPEPSNTILPAVILLLGPG
jgi:uncharacterized membrane protein YhaH (DUF805 family)